VRIGIVTVSDRSSRRERADTSGPALAEVIYTQGWEVIETTIIPDEFQTIRELLADWSDSHRFDIILTTGGTGFARRDVTPEATRAVIEREAPGLAEAMRAASLQKTPHAMLSRAVTGLRGGTLLINLPGSPRGAVENLQTVLPVLPHAVQLLQGDPGAEAGHTPHPNPE
jgi:molybdopterin adenylyltransferase